MFNTQPLVGVTKDKMLKWEGMFLSLTYLHILHTHLSSLGSLPTCPYHQQKCLVSDLSPVVNWFAMAISTTEQQMFQKSETRMTASILKQDPTYKRFKRSPFIRTKQNKIYACFCFVLINSSFFTRSEFFYSS